MALWGKRAREISRRMHPERRLRAVRERGQEVPGDGAGLELLGVVDVERLAGALPAEAGPEDDEATSRLRRLAALALAGLGRAEAIRRLAAAPEDELVDLVAEAATAADPARLGLPAWGLAVEVTAAAGLPLVHDPLAALACLTRRSGALFIARMPPRLADVQYRVAPFVLLAPRPAGGRP